MQTCGLRVEPSTGFCATRLIQSWIAFVTWGTTIRRHTVEWARVVDGCKRMEIVCTLDSLAKVVATTLTLDDVLVDFSGGDVVVAGKLDIEEALVVAKVEINLTPVVKNEDLT
jgi:hypothetical protein